MNLLLKDITYIIKMGRKTRNKLINKDKDIKINDDILSDEESSDDETWMEEELNIISNVREDIIKYCDLNCIPLCDYLTIDKLMNLLYFFKENY